MASKIKNIIIFSVIAILLVLGYIFFLKPAPDEGNLVSSSTDVATTTSSGTSTIDQNSSVSRDLLAILLNVKNVKLDDSIFANIAFINLHDSSIALAPPSQGEEGRPNPFAPIGYDPAVMLPPVTPVVPEIPPAIPPSLTCVLPQILDVLTNTCITPVKKCTLPKILNTTTNTCVTPLKCTLPKVLNPSTNTCVTPPAVPQP